MKKTTRDEMLEIKEMEIISIEEERCLRGNWKDVHITGIPGILRTIFLDKYMKHKPVYDTDVRKTLAREVKALSTRVDCIALEFSKMHEGYEHDDSEKLVKAMADMKIVHDCANYIKPDTLLTLEGNEYEMRELVQNLCKQKSFSNYALEAFVFLMMHGENQKGERIIPLDGVMNEESDILVTIARTRFEQQSMQIDIIENCSLRSLSDYHIYLFFLMRNMYIPVSMHGEILENKTLYLIAEPEDDYLFLKKNCKPIEILNIILSNETLKCLVVWYVPCTSAKTKVERSKNTTFWIDLKEIDDWRIVLSYFKTRAPHIKTMDNEILKKNFVGLYEPTITEEEAFMQRSDWISFKKKDFDQQEIKEGMKLFLKIDPSSKPIYSHYTLTDRIYFVTNVTKDPILPTEETVEERNDVVEANTTENTGDTGDTGKQDVSKKRKIEDSQMATRNIKRRKGEDLKDLKEDLKFAMSKC